MAERTLIVFSPADPFQLMERFAQSEEDFLQGILHDFCTQDERRKCEAKGECEGFAPGIWDKTSRAQVVTACKKFAVTISVALCAEEKK